MAEKKSSIITLYEEADAGATVAFDASESVTAAIDNYLGLVKQIRADYQDNEVISSGLKEIESRLNSLRFAKEPEESVFKKLEQLVQVPIGKDKRMRLDAFRRSADRAQVADSKEYVSRVARLVRNTMNNLTLLLITGPDDEILKKFLSDLKVLDLKSGYGTVKERMGTVGKGPQLWHYNQKKKSFLLEWLKPFQKDIGKPIESMTDEQFQEALRQVEALKEKQLVESGALVVEKDREPYRAHNLTMHPVLNGKQTEFWVEKAVRDEFVALINRLIVRFSFNLQDRFLLFKTQDGGFLYLVGFAEEAFEKMVGLDEGKLGLYPHLKVFLKRGEEYQEINPANYAVNRQAYFRTLKTAVLPFFVAIAPMVDHTLSSDLKAAFDSWI